MSTLAVVGLADLLRDIDLIREALLDYASGPLPDHDAMCSYLMDPRRNKCNCSVSRNGEAREALERVAAKVREMAL